MVWVVTKEPSRVSSDGVCICSVGRPLLSDFPQLVRGLPVGATGSYVRTSTYVVERNVSYVDTTFGKVTTNLFKGTFILSLGYAV